MYPCSVFIANTMDTQDSFSKDGLMQDHGIFVGDISSAGRG